MSKRSTLWLEQMATTMKQHGVAKATRKLTKSNGTVEELTVELAPFAAPLAGTGRAISPALVMVEQDEQEGAEEASATPDEVARAAKRRRYEALFPRGLSDEELDQLPEYP